MAATLPSAKDLGVVGVQPGLGVATYRGATGNEGDAAAGLIYASKEIGAVAQRLDKAQEEFDAIQAEDRFNQYQEKLNELANDPESGWRTAKGENAIKPEFVQKYTEQFEEERKRVAGTLGTANAQRRFGQLSAAAAMRNRAALYAHSADERVQYEAKVANDSLMLVKENAWRSHGNDQSFEADMARGRSITESFARRMGMSEESVQLAVQQFDSSLWSARIQGALDSGNWPLANTLRDKATGSLTTTDRARIDAHIKQVSMPQQRAQVAASVTSEILQQSREMANVPVVVPAQGASRGLVDVVKDIESGNGKYLKNPHTSSSGIMGVTNETWKRFMGNKPRGNPADEEAAGTAYLGAVQQHLQTQLGRQPENWEVYLGYQQGEGGGTALLKAAQATPNASAVDVLTPLYGNRAMAEKAIVLNGGKTTSTASEFVQRWKQEFTRREGTGTQTDARYPDATDVSLWLRTQAQPAYDRAKKAWLDKFPWDAVGADAAGNEARSQIAQEVQAREQDNRVAAETLGGLALSLKQPESERPASQAEFEARLSPEQRRMWDTAHVEQKRAVLSILKHNQMTKLGEADKSDPSVLNEVTRKITSGEIKSAAQLAPYVGIPAAPDAPWRPGLNGRDYSHLASMVSQMNQQTQSPFEQQKRLALQNVHSAITSYSQMFGSEMMPGNSGFSARATMLWVNAVDQKAKDYAAQGKDPMALFDPASKDNVVSGAFMQGILTKATETPAVSVVPLSEKEQKDAKRLSRDPAAAEKEYAALPAGAPYMAYVNGKWRHGRKGAGAQQ